MVSFKGTPETAQFQKTPGSLLAGLAKSFGRCPMASSPSPPPLATCTARRPRVRECESASGGRGLSDAEKVGLAQRGRFCLGLPFKPSPKKGSPTQTTNTDLPHCSLVVPRFWSGLVGGVARGGGFLLGRITGGPFGVGSEAH